MPPCPPGTIRNPASKRCVDINGTVGKKLVKSFVAKEIELEAENVEKLKAMGIVPSAAVAPVAPVAPAAAAATPSANGLPCPPDKIRNPKTKRCVYFDTPLGKSLIKDHKNKKIQLEAENVAKLQANGLLAPAPATAPAKPAPAKTAKVAAAKPIPDFKVPEKMKNLLLAKAKEAKKRLKFNYVDDQHEQDCKAKKYKEIKRTSGKEVVNLTFNYVTGGEIASNQPIKFTKQTQFITTNYNNLNKEYALAFKPDIDMDWFNKSNEYIKKLSIEDFYSIRQYTGVGDKVINGILRKHSKPSHACFAVTFFCGKELILSADFKATKYIAKNGKFNIEIPDILPEKQYSTEQILEFLHEHGNLLTNQQFYHVMMNVQHHMNVEFWKKCVDLYVERVNRIIKQSPPVTKKMTVWRGVKNDYFLKGSKKGMYKNQGFISTSLRSSTAKGFVTGKCCLTKITLLPGAKAVFIGGMSGLPHELEVLLPEDTVYYLLYGKKTVLSYLYGVDAASNVCGRNMHSLFMSEVVVVK